MASGKRGSSTGRSGPVGRRSRQPRTIELTATEIATAPRAKDAPSANTPYAAADAAAPADAASPDSAATGSTRPDSQAEAPSTESERLRANVEGGRPGGQGPAGNHTPRPEPWYASVRMHAMGLIAADRFRPFAVGGIAGAALVLLFLSALWIAGLLSSGDGQLAALAGRLTHIENQLRELAGRPAPANIDVKAIEDLSARLARIESAAPRPDPALAGRLNTIEGAMTSVTNTVADLSRRIDNVATATGEVKNRAEQAAFAAREARARADEVATAGRAAMARADEAATAGRAAMARAEEAATTGRAAMVRAEAAAVAAAEATQKATRLSEAQGEHNDALAGRIGALEKSAKSIGDELARRAPDDAGDRAMRLAIAAEALKDAVERGASFSSELAAAKAVAADPKPFEAIEPFAGAGVPSAAALTHELAGLVPAIRRAARPTARDAGLMEKLQANAEKLVRIRPVGETAGDDPAAVIARIEAKAERNDVAGALAELAKLSETARAPAVAWIKRAQARDAAIAAGRRVAIDALAALGKSAP